MTKPGKYVSLSMLAYMAVDIVWAMTDQFRPSSWIRQLPVLSLLFSTGRTADRVPNASILHGTESVNSGRVEASVLQSARQVDIQGGNFNTAGTQQLNLTINVGERRPEEDPQERVAGSSRDNITQEIREEATSNRNDRDDSTLWTEPPVQRSYDIYYRHIAVNRRGSPLWIPGPNQVLPVGYRRDGTTIGDVGIITEFGSFDCLFNIYLPHNDPINLLQVPDSFTPFTYSHRAIQKRSEFGANSHLSSPSVKKARSGLNGITFESSASEGAILAMPCGSHSEDIASIFSLREYLTPHVVEAWYRHIITELGREVQNGDVRLVTGWDKTKAWGMATFSEPTAQQEPLLLQFKPTSQGNVGMAYGWDFSGSANARAGPGAEEIEELRMSDPSQDGVQYDNQTLFVRTLNVTLQEATWKKLACDVELLEIDDGPSSTTNAFHSRFSRDGGFSASGSSALNPATRSENGGYNSTSRGATSIQLPHLRMALAEHPSKGINEMLLKLNPTAKMVITDDNDWISVIRGDDTILPSAETLCERIMTSHIVCDEGGTIYLQKKPVLESPKTSLMSPSLILNKGNQSTSLALSLLTPVTLGVSSLATIINHPQQLGFDPLSSTDASQGCDFFPNTPQRGAVRPNADATDYPPRSFHCDPPSPTDISQGASSGDHGTVIQMNSDPGAEQNFEALPSSLRSNSPDLVFKKEVKGRALKAQQNLTMEHPSPESDVYSSLHDPDAFSTKDNSLRFEHMQSPRSLPSHEETEAYLRQNLRIHPPQEVNLNASPDERFSTRVPRIPDLIKLAIWGSPSKKLTLRQIYDAIETRYPSWKTASDKPWQRSIRHNLSLKAIFVRMERPASGKACYWALDVRQGEGHKMHRRRKYPVDSDGDEDEPNPTRRQFEVGPYMPPQNLFQSRGPANAMTLPLGYMSPPAVNHYSSRAIPNSPSSPAVSAPHLQHFTHPIMAPSGMQMSRANTYPTMGLPRQVEHYSQMRGGGPIIAGHDYAGPFPPMPPRYGNPPGYNAPPRARRPGSDISLERDTGETDRSSRRPRAH